MSGGHRTGSGPTTRGIDLNSDLGEGFGVWALGDDEAMLGIVSSANVACGFHAGDPSILRRVCAQASRHGVVIGAQVSYRDLAGFGRRAMDVDPATLTDDVLYQIAALDGLAKVAGSAVRYVKPHGALYHTVVHDARQAAAVIDAVRLYDPALPVLGLPGSALLRRAADAGLRPVTEAFADRGYTPEGTLVPRSRPGAALLDIDEVAARVLDLLTTGTVRSTAGTDVAISAESVCVHGDTPGAVHLARAVRDRLTAAGIPIRPFVSASGTAS